MTPEELKSVDTSALVAELKRRMAEIEQARQELGFSSNEAPVRTRRVRFVNRSTPKSSNTMKAAALDRWSGWKAYQAKHPNASTKEYFKARRAGKA